VHVKRFGCLLAICGIAGVIAGCSVSFSSKETLKQSDLESTMQDDVTKNFPSLPLVQSADCPGDVESKVGVTFECQATLENGQTVTIPYRVKSTSDSGGQTEANPDVINQALAVDVVYRAASGEKSVDCPTDVPAEAGKTFDCTVTFTDGSSQKATLGIQKATPEGAQYLKFLGHSG
jgi:hypothetical protein